MKMRKPTIYTTGQVAKLCAVSIRTVARWIEMEHLKAFRLPGEGSEFRVMKKDLLEFMNNFGLPTDHIGEDLGYKILVIDPDEKALKAMKKALDEIPFDYTLQTYSSITEGLINIGLFEPHLIIYNFEINGFDGSKFYEYIQTEPTWQNTKLIILSQNVTDLMNMQVTGQSFVLAKPLKYEELVKKSTRLLKKVNLK